MPALASSAYSPCSIRAHGDPQPPPSPSPSTASASPSSTPSAALYHSLRQPEEQLDRWQRLDHTAIFLLLAGTYAPLCLVSLRGLWAWGLGGAVLALATFGIVGSRHGLPDWARVLLYAVIGWLALVAAGPLRHALSPEGFGWLLAGGLLYTAGGLVFAADRPHLWPGRFSAHDLWHLFVLAGSACHYVVMLRYVAPAPH